MSTTNTQTQIERPSPSQAPVNERPRLAVTGVVESVGQPKTTGDGEGDYVRAEVVIKATRGSKKVFASIMFRPEMFSFGAFDVQRDYLENKTLAEAILTDSEGNIKTDSQGNPKTAARSFSSVYAMNLFVPEKNTKGELLKRLQKQTPLTSIVGGSVERYAAFLDRLYVAYTQLPADRQPGEFGYKEFTSEEIVALLNAFIQANPPIEQCFILRQRREMNGQLSENYEIANYYGPFTEDIDKSISASISKHANGPTAKKLVRVYSTQN